MISLFILKVCFLLECSWHIYRASLWCEFFHVEEAMTVLKVYYIHGFLGFVYYEFSHVL